MSCDAPFADSGTALGGGRARDELSGEPGEPVELAGTVMVEGWKAVCGL